MRSHSIARRGACGCQVAGNVLLRLRRADLRCALTFERTGRAVAWLRPHSRHPSQRPHVDSRRSPQTLLGLRFIVDVLPHPAASVGPIVGRWEVGRGKVASQRRAQREAAGAGYRIRTDDLLFTRPLLRFSLVWLSGQNAFHTKGSDLVASPTDSPCFSSSRGPNADRSATARRPLRDLTANCRNEPDSATPTTPPPDSANVDAWVWMDERLVSRSVGLLGV